MKIFVVYTSSGDDGSEVLFEGAFHTEAAARKHITDTFTLQQSYGWSVQELELDTKPYRNPFTAEPASSSNLVKCHSCGSMVSHARYYRPRR